MRKISNGNIFKIIIISAFDSENFKNTGFGFGPFFADRERKCSESKRRKRQSFLPCGADFVPDLKNGHCYQAQRYTSQLGNS